MTTPPIRSVFFGTPRFAMIVLEELLRGGHVPSLVVTAPDRPRGRGLVVSPCETKAFAIERHLPVLSPERLDTEAIDRVRAEQAEVFIVAAYGKILRPDVLAIPPRGTLNVHPSLLPKFRGASPIESFLLSDDEHTGVSIMLLDAEMDHGPIVAQRERVQSERTPKGSLLTDDLAHFGGTLLAEVLPSWVRGDLRAIEQDHTQATYTKKITKEDGLLDLDGDPIQNVKKVRAFDEWPGTYYFLERDGKHMRIRVTDAHVENGRFVIDRVIPEGKKEMRYEDFVRAQ